MKVLVTGAAGYIGSHTAKALAKAGMRPVVYDNLSEGHREAVKWGPLVEADLCDRGVLKQAIREHEIKAAIHFAARAYVGESIVEPRKYFQNNVTNSLNLLDALLDAGVDYFVFSSSCAVYGLPQSIPISEDHPKAPINPYGEAKLFIERVLEWYGHAYDLKWAALRYFNAAGADPDGQLGEVHDPETHLLPIAMQAALGMREQVEIFGTDYPTPDGTAVRDYIHVSDLAEGHVLALQHLLSSGRSFVANLGSERGFSVRQVIAEVEQTAGRAIKVISAPRRPGDPPTLVADPTRAHKLLNWTPKFSALETIVSTAWQWHVHVCQTGPAHQPRKSKENKPITRVAGY